MANVLVTTRAKSEETQLIEAQNAHITRSTLLLLERPGFIIGFHFITQIIYFLTQIIYYSYLVFSTIISTVNS